MPRGYYVNDNGRNWTEQQRLLVSELLQAGEPYTRIAAKVGRTTTAVHVFIKRNLRCRNERPLSSRAVARLLGVGCPKVVARWVRAGWLRGHRRMRAGPNRRVSVLYGDLLTFLEDSRYWHVWKPARITDRRLRHGVTQLGRTRYLTPGEVGARLGVGSHAVNDYIHRGLLPARRWGNYWIAESDLTDFVAPCQRQRKRAAAAVATCS